MFIIEFVVNFWNKRKRKNLENDISSFENQPYPLEDYEACEHIFMPVDSTGEILSCTKCGMLKKRYEMKKKNFFEK